MVNALEQGLLALLLVVLMLGMGASLDPASFRAIAKRPTGLLVGVASQFGWMPLVAVGLATVLALPPPAALALLLVGCTPGGTTSNLFAWYGRANVALSVAMTVTSSVVAVVAMPLVLALYAPSLLERAAVAAPGAEFARIEVPWKGLMVTLALILVPVSVGMRIAVRAPSKARIVERVGAWAGSAVLALILASSLLRNSDRFASVPLGGYVAALGLGTAGMVLGWGAARLARLPREDRRAVALETGIQNSPLAIGMISLSFPAPLRDEMLVLPLLYALLVLITASGAAALFRRSSARDAAETP
jgi:BASS family bile acid:Na+ symporter